MVGLRPELGRGHEPAGLDSGAWQCAPPSDPAYDGFFFGEPPWFVYEDEADWVFAEDGVRLVFSKLGFPPFDQIVDPGGSGELDPEEDLRPREVEEEIDPVVSARVEAAVLQVVELLVQGDYLAIERSHGDPYPRAGALARTFEEPVAMSGHTLVMPESDWWSLAEITRWVDSPNEFLVDVPLWTVSEGEIGLSAHLLVTEDRGEYHAELRNIDPIWSDGPRRRTWRRSPDSG